MNMPDPQAFANAWMAQISDPNQWQSWFKMMPEMDAVPGAALLRDAGATVRPEAMEQLQNQYMGEFGALWQEFLTTGKAPSLKDRRFSSEAWQGNPVSAFNAASYLLNSKFLMQMAEAVDASPHQKQKIRFAVQQLVDAMSPANFLATNPEAHQKLIETKGESLTKGLANLLGDIQKGHISLSDEKAFEVGRNLATTEGQVVYENELFQLIQYTPLTKTVHERPLLMVPPCINKYYILDLQPENSLVRYAVKQGNTVFLVSWRNPDQSLAGTTWDDYIEKGVINAISIAREITRQDKLNVLGFCVGGTLVSTALAVLAARGEQPAAGITLLTTFLDFSDTGVLNVFVDEPQVQLREQTLKSGGLMPGRDLASTFSSLRPNDLVWNYVQSNYLKGNEPPPFDLLYWNSDSTNLPGPMFCWYLRNTYLENSLKVPGKLTVAGEKVDLSKIQAPAFIYASREDHIVPWNSAYQSTKLLNNKNPELNKFILGASGHIAGVINPAAKKKRSYWTNDARPASHDEWFNGAAEHPGSWWGEWAEFLAANGGKDVKARSKLGSASYEPIEPAPGRYVKAKAD
ncbi:class I poly(R)-hydroxyalkanoic acid synthase [Duganella sp. Root198D2]|uniref:class I poly(R)-hydroxyalkanoic acid synthase n=1 Tax=Duganella sp. Root198D2 TaxID=1736489 RepID=UPI00070AEFA9|nr:class I poly(R)-hydroxyalkanoic acid synthase [Duganella sp. Root198D2]KRC01498.1 poly(R)-hydroxyalkanoic acid synthase [Duganella sp. Root198D2]